MKLAIFGLALVIAVSAPVSAHESPDPALWPSGSELRRDLQAIGYEFEFRPGIFDLEAERYRDEEPPFWQITLPVDVLFRDLDLELEPGPQVSLGASLHDPVRVSFYADGSQSATTARIGPFTTAMAEVLSRLPIGREARDEIVRELGLIRLGFGIGKDLEPGESSCRVVEFADGAATIRWTKSEADEEGRSRSGQFWAQVARFTEDPTLADRLDECRELGATQE